MEIVNELVQALLPYIITGLTALFGYLGTRVKKHLDNQTKKDVAKTVVGAIEQLYKDLHGEEKYNKAVENITSMLKEKGIKISELEMKLLIENAVNEFNKNVKGE